MHKIYVFFVRMNKCTFLCIPYMRFYAQFIHSVYAVRAYKIYKVNIHIAHIIPHLCAVIHVTQPIVYSPLFIYF